MNSISNGDANNAYHKADINNYYYILLKAQITFEITNYICVCCIKSH